ncbi:FtsP/CotA-like multicopper oxidase with cupredoxin domain [Saccharomonospora amisosensis]|uniref:FtsP/CotA-like multicopper oxidase with cupredoxin domain n=1 Tax=Saccharomonospora amisosensis TaxID=1128677 RepID=A0A7X5UNQ1_9PSEU|nr:multicopper oxidase family protein [Saccharomonospora amisosensis]NIJ11388.1 FtsP/CotA-like multicopper oxidase with cupredoxin domain [Saccharomonospora amisosensis]
MSANRFGRRSALVLAAAGTAGVAAGVTGWVTGIGTSTDRSEPAASGDPLTDPEQVSSSDGVLALTLTAAPGVSLAGRSTSALGFNGSSPGPTLRLRPGEVLRVRLVNELDQPTNLHTHGLHVSPEGNGDNPFLSIEPGQTFDYEIRLPEDHPPGTFWYHPHRHGYVADQLFGGLAGAIVVRGGPDLGTAADRPLLISDISLDGSGNVVSPGPPGRMMGRQGDLVLVNGQHQPVVSARAGTSQRWRVINTCTSRVLSLRLEGHRLAQLSSDGMFLPAPVERDRLVLAPGGRADVLVRPRDPGSYRLLTDPVDRGHPGMGGMGGMGPGTATATGPITVARLAVSGQSSAAAPLPGPLPTPPSSLRPGPVDNRRQIAFTMGMGMRGPGMSFGFDGRQFDPQRTDQRPALGATEEWLVTNSTPMDHPFHLHVWPFQVVETSTGSTTQDTLRDVVLVPAGGWVRLRVRFADFPGRSVYHCHILDHEDLGMMATVHVKS